MTRYAKSLVGLALGVASLALLGAACGGRVETGNDHLGSETHWLKGCSSFQDCPGDCICGVCTMACTDSATCTSGPPGSTCAAAGSSALEAMCGSAPMPAGACLLPCQGHCPAGSSCVADHCVPDFVDGDRDGGVASDAGADGPGVLDAGGDGSNGFDASLDASLDPSFDASVDAPPDEGPSCGPLVGEVDIGPNAIRSLTFSPDGELLAISTEQHGILVLTVGEGTILYRFSDQMAFASDAAFSPDGAVLAGGGTAANIPLWNMSDGTLMRSIATGCLEVFDLEFTHDGQFLLTACNTEDVILRRVSDGSVVRTFSTGIAVSVSISPDDARVAVVDMNGFLTTWRTDTGAQLWRTTASTAQRVMFSPDGRYLAVNPNQTAVWIVDAETGNTVQALSPATEAVWAGVDRLVTDIIPWSFQVWTGTPGSIQKTCSTGASPMYHAFAAFAPGNLVAVPASVTSTGSTIVGTYSIAP